MDYLSLIRRPIQAELDDFVNLFNSSLTHQEALQEEIFSHIRNRSGKRMRPILMLLMAKNFGGINKATLHAAVGLELLHTASLVHDDVVDESPERRGQASVNAAYNNKVAVLIGDYILSTALLHVSHTHHEQIVMSLAELGRTLSNGEILQITSNTSDVLSEETYYSVIHQKTAALFEACCGIGAISASADDRQIDAAKNFGRLLGIIFQIRDDIFDYYDSAEIGKPTGNDMAEGKLTLPVLYALQSTANQEMLQLALKVRRRLVTTEEIARLVAFTKENGGIEYAEQRMFELRDEAFLLIQQFVEDAAIADALTAYLDFVIKRNK